MGFMYQHITVEQRAQIGFTVALFQGTYGLVTGFARDFGTSRKFIYTLANKVRIALAETLAPKPPGPPPHSQAILVDRARLDRAILTLALVTHASQRGIAQCLAEIYQVEPSLGYVNAVLQKASNAAASFNQTLPLPLKEAQVEADELFALDKAHLVAVDHNSLLILSLTQPQHCDASAWQESLRDLQARGVNLARLASDGGKALEKAVCKFPEVEHQLDLWHALRHIGRVKRALEQVAYTAIGKEWELEKRASVMKASHVMGGYVWERYERARNDADEKIVRYEQLCTLGAWVREALEAVDLVNGRIRTHQECLEELTAAIELMRELKVNAVDKLANYLEKSGPGLLRYVERVGAQMQALGEELGEEGVRRLFHEWCLQMQVNKGRGSQNIERKKDYERAHLVALMHWGKDYKVARGRVEECLTRVMRGSSLAECVNSWLRPYADLMKGIKDGLLPLFTLYRNSHVFKRGKRAGHSPMELAGIETPQGDWLDWIGLGPKVPQRRSVRSLP